MTDPKLLPCPFCGCDAVFEPNDRVPQVTNYDADEARDEEVNDGSADAGGVPDRAGTDVPVRDSADDLGPSPVTEGVYVGRGDRVWGEDDLRGEEEVWRVVGPTFLVEDCVWCEDAGGTISWFWYSDVRTLDGHPVAGFMEKGGSDA